MAGLKECRRRSFRLHLRRQDPRAILYVSPAALAIPTRKSVLEGSCAVNCNKSAITSGRRERRSLKRRERNPRKAYALLKRYGGKMKRCSSVLNIATGKAVEATFPSWRDHFNTLLNRQAPSTPELKHVHMPTYAVTRNHRPRRKFRSVSKR
ncbi:hypothetical protein RB195_022522 [Necator americanus]|uniref:Uncharacterized protein n=1 Tax=Necator americanus TaxID=51031 RepID=A0ABR1EFW7_NECAM